MKSIQEEARFQLSSDLLFLYFAAKICGICYNQKFIKQNKRHECEKCPEVKKGWQKDGWELIESESKQCTIYMYEIVKEQI